MGNSSTGGEKAPDEPEVPEHEEVSRIAQWWGISVDAGPIERAPNRQIWGDLRKQSRNWVKTQSINK